MECEIFKTVEEIKLGERMNQKILEAYKLAYEAANKKELRISFDDKNKLFYIEGLPYYISKMPSMTEQLNLRIQNKAIQQ